MLHNKYILTLNNNCPIYWGIYTSFENYLDYMYAYHSFTDSLDLPGFREWFIHGGSRYQKRSIWIHLIPEFNILESNDKKAWNAFINETRTIFNVFDSIKANKSKQLFNRKIKDLTKDQYIVIQKSTPIFVTIHLSNDDLEFMKLDLIDRIGFKNER
jgi:hypothetical protein